MDMNDTQSNADLEQPPGDTSSKKRTRGPTQMRKVWGRREGEPLLQVGCNDLGQPDDDMAPSLSNFIGALMRDGKNAPLSYLSWHNVPKDYKNRLWDILKTYYDIPESSKTWTMQKFGKQLREWRSRVKKSCYKDGLSFEEMKKLKDDRVSDDNFQHLVAYWSSDRAKQVSERNKAARASRTLNHTTGPISFARVLKKQTKKLERVPRQSEFFKHCYTKKDGTQAEVVQTTINEISEKESENPNLATEFRSINDSYAQVMGQDKNGKVRMLGAGVCPSMVFNNISTRGADQMKLIKKLQEQNNQLQTEVNQLRSNALHAPINESINNDQRFEDLTPILQVARREDWSFPSSDNVEGSFKIGESICLKSIIKPTETIALGLLYSTDPSKEVGNQELGTDHWEVYIEVAVNPQERLVRSCAQYKNIGQAVGDYIAWPKAYIAK